MLELTHNQGFSWIHRGEVWAKGYLFDAKNHLHDDDALAAYFAETDSADAFRAKLLEANGSFAVVIQRPDLTLAAVDRLRSIPLFYGLRDHLLLTDDAYWLRDAFGDTNLNERATAEFLRSGYVVGADTLSPRVKQLQAGEYLAYSATGLKREFYYRHLHGDYLDLDEQEHFAQLEAISTRVFERLIASARGRTLVVPLSGGYDSRYIAAMLKRLDYPHVICYTYGRPSSFEVATSQQVAECLGFPWHFVEYTPEKWAWYASAPEVTDYHRYASNLASLPHVQEFLAIKELLAGGKIPDDSIFVPGFSGDLLGGSYVPPETTNASGARRLLREGIVSYLYRRHLYLENPISRAVAEDIRMHLAETLAAKGPPTTIEGFASLNEAWFTEHKVAKFVVNALRLYELFGYSWRMPLWDNALMGYWYRVPLSERRGDKLYDRYLLRRVFADQGVAFAKPVPRPALKGRMNRYFPEGLWRNLRHAYWRIRKQDRALDVNAFAHLSEHFYRDLRALDKAVTQTSDINQAFAPWLMARLESDLFTDGRRP